MRLKELRDEKNLTQEDIAQAINTSRPNISRWEKELNEPAASQIVKLADFFGCSTDYLLGRSDDLGVISIANEKSPSLSKDELELIEEYRTLAPYLQEMLKATIRTWKGVPQENFQERGMKK